MNAINGLKQWPNYLHVIMANSGASDKNWHLGLS